MRSRDIELTFCWALQNVFESGKNYQKGRLLVSENVACKILHPGQVPQCCPPPLVRHWAHQLFIFSDKEPKYFRMFWVVFFSLGFVKFEFQVSRCQLTLWMLSMTITHVWTRSTWKYPNVHSGDPISHIYWTKDAANLVAFTRSHC